MSRFLPCVVTWNPASFYFFCVSPYFHSKCWSPRWNTSHLKFRPLSVSLIMSSKTWSHPIHRWQRNSKAWCRPLICATLWLRLVHPFSPRKKAKVKKSLAAFRVESLEIVVSAFQRMLHAALGLGPYVRVVAPTPTSGSDTLALCGLTDGASVLAELRKTTVPIKLNSNTKTGNPVTVKHCCHLWNRWHQRNQS